MPVNKFRQHGVSLIEILVSLAIGLLIMSGVLQVYLSTIQNSSMVRGNSLIQEHVRLLFTRLETDVTNAGYAGCLNFNSGAQRIEDVAVQNTVPTFNINRFVEGVDNELVNNKAFDRLVLRYAGNSDRVVVEETASDRFVVAASDSAGFNQGDIVIAGDCSGIGVFRVSNDPGTTGIIRFEIGAFNHGSLTMDFAAKDSILPSITYLYNHSGAFAYYVATSTTGNETAMECSTENPKYCSLYRKSTSSDVADELIEGVEAFEVEYGWRDAVTGNLFFANAASVPAASWPLIDRVKVSATLISQDKAPTNEGVDYLEKSFARTFFLFNQVPEV